MTSRKFPATRKDRAAKVVPAVPKTGIVIYCRVSTEDQLKNFSIETQEKYCRDFCERSGYKVLMVFQEAGSAKNTDDRPQFKAMLAYCGENAGRIRAVVVYAVTRFSRSVQDYARTCKELEDRGIRLLSVTEPCDDTAGGRMFGNMLAVFSQFDNDTRSERTRAGMMTALKAGKWTHKAPIGYLNSQASGGLSHDPERARLVRRAFELYADGHSKTAVLQMVTDLGLRTCKSGKRLSPQTLDKMLRSPLYAGWITSSWGITTRGKFDPLIDDALFSRAEVRQSGNVVTGVRCRDNAEFPLRVYVRCAECGEGLTGSLAKGRSRRYPYYFCRKPGCRAVKFKREELHRLFTNLLHSLAAHGAFMPLFKVVLEKVWEERQADQAAALAVAEKRGAELQDKKQRLIEALIDGRLDKATYDDQITRVGTALHTLHIGEEKASIAKEELLSLLDFAEWMIERIPGIWYSAAVANQKRIQAAFFPEGLSVSSEGFGTALKPLFFHQFQPIPTDQSSLASPGGFEPPLPP